MLRFNRTISNSIYLINRRSLFTAYTAKNAIKTTVEDSSSTSSSNVKSSCAAGTVLNLKIKKSGPEPIALEDHEYPEWLWKVLDPKEQQAKLDSDPARKAKKEMRLRNKQKIKLNNFVTQMK